MRLGIMPVLSGLSGGVYQYSLTMLQALARSSSDGHDDDYFIFAHDTTHPYAVSLRDSGWTVKPLHAPSLKRRVLHVLGRMPREGAHRQALSWLRRKWNWKTGVPDPDVIQSHPAMRRWFQQLGVELMIYPAPNRLSFETGLPYIMAIHDLQHRLHPEFPEVSASGEWERREYLFRNGTRHATMLVVDSEVGKEDVLNFYGIHGVTPDRVHVLPFLPASYLDADVSENERQRVRTHYHLPERYLFYPAQFWPHKNHVRVVQALALLKQERCLRIPVVFCGTYPDAMRKRTFHDVMSLAKHSGIDQDILSLGYVPDENMSGLYAEALAVVMPTFFGPTNIPVLEAWAFGCPVLTSDIRGIRDQVGDAAVLVDPRSVESIADGMCRLWTDEPLRRTLASRARRKLTAYTAEHYRRRLMEILEEAKDRVRAEKPLFPRRL